MKQTSSTALKRYNHLIGEIEAVYHQMSLQYGLSDSAMRILYTICDSGSAYPLQDICRDSGLQKQTVNSALRKLEADGMVYLEQTDAKHKTVCLTSAGQQLANATARKIIQLENDIFAAWPQSDVQAYLMLTERFLHDLQQRATQLSTKGDMI